ncbi:MAG: hypothetical protein EOO17_03475 [Chloroflexi bacterium]|nr:MAG: hypothetical protein EOO17_03475 [Chloroflexota bacterium]
MAANTPQGEQHLRWCADRAIRELDAGSARNALASVMSDFGKDSTTAGISKLQIVAIVGPAVDKGRNELERAIMGFNV